MNQECHPATPDQSEHRTAAMPPLVLVELDPEELVNGVRLHEGYQVEEVSSFGRVREVCPACKDVHLCLVLRQKNVRMEHLFCERCTRCYDACCATDGSSALSLA